MKTLPFAALPALLLAGALSLPAQASVPLYTFDVPTANTLTTESNYGVTVAGGIASAVVEAGWLQVFGTGGVNGDIAFGRPADDLHFEFDTTTVGTPGFVNVGFHAGGTRFYFHPGFWSNYALGVAGPPSGVESLGFVPAQGVFTHVTLDIQAASKTFTLKLDNGANSFSRSYVDSTYSPGLSTVGLTMGSVGGTANYAVFDNVIFSPAVTAPVPEPASVALMGMGLAALAAGVRRRRTGG